MTCAHSGRHGFEVQNQFIHFLLHFYNKSCYL